MMDKKIGVYCVLLTAVISGVSIFLNGVAVKGFDSSVFTFSKNVVVSSLLFAIMLGLGQARQLLQLKKNQWLQLGIIGFLGGSVPFLLFFKGLQLTTGATAGFMQKTLFVFGIVFAVLFLKEKLTKGMAAGAALLLIGNYLVLRPSFAFAAGHLLVLAAAILWAAEYVVAKRALKTLTGNQVAFGRMFFGSLFILAFLLATGKAGLVFAMNAAQYGWIAFTAVLLLAYVMSFYNGLKHVSVITAACILTLGSPITTALTLLKGGVVSPFEISGALFIAMGIASVLLLNKEGVRWTAFA